MKNNKITDIHILKKKVVLYFNDEKIEINPNTYTEFNLYLNKVLSKVDLDKLKAFDSYTKDLSYALNLIGKYAYTKSKLKKKLIAKKIKDTNINMIMRYLEEHHLIDDLAFAVSYADSLIKRRKGPIFIKERLKELGISEEDSNKVINNIDIDEMLAALVDLVLVLDTKYARKKAINKKDKIIASLLRSGYKLKDIKDVLSKVKLSKVDYVSAIKKDYAKFKRQYDERQKIINALKRKGYSYSKIKSVMEEDYDFS